MRECEIIWDVEKVTLAHLVIKTVLGTVCVDECNSRCPFIRIEIEIKPHMSKALVKF